MAERRALTNYRRERDKSGHGEESDRVRGTHELETTEERQVRAQKEKGEKSENIIKNKDKKVKTDRILVVTFFQQQATIQTIVLQLTQNDGKAIMHVFITASLLSFP